MTLLTALRRCALAENLYGPTEARKCWAEAKAVATRAGIDPNRFLMAANWIIPMMMQWADEGEL